MGTHKTHYNPDGIRYGDGTAWQLNDRNTPCADDPRLFDPVRADKEKAYTPENPRIQEAISRCYRGTSDNPGECPLLMACRDFGKNMKHRHGGIYGGIYFSSTLKGKDVG